MRKHRHIVWILVALLALPPMTGIADEEKQEGLRRIGGLTFVDEIELTIANLVVYVTDKKGNPITDLSASGSMSSSNSLRASRPMRTSASRSA